MCISYMLRLKPIHKRIAIGILSGLLLYPTPVTALPTIINSTYLSQTVIATGNPVTLQSLVDVPLKPTQAPRNDLLDEHEYYILMKESGDRDVCNSHSTACGRFQLLLNNRIRYGLILGINPNTHDRNEQIALGKAYIKERYQTSANARAFWDSHSWY